MTEVLDRGDTINGVTQQPRSVNISIANIFSKINPSDEKVQKIFSPMNTAKTKPLRVGISKAKRIKKR